MSMAVDTVKTRRRRGRKGEKINDDGDQTSDSLLLQLTETWYNELKENPERNKTAGSGARPSSTLVQEYRSKADAIYKREVQIFNQGSSKSKDDRWVESTMKSGTLRDRIAAMSVVVSTDPVHKLYAMDGLLNMAGCQDDSQTNSRVAQLASEALQDLFVNTYLPPDRKLIGLHLRPFNDYADSKRTLSPRILLLWYFEELVAAKYEQFLSRYIAHTLRDGLEMDKINAIRSAAQLLSNVPQGEATLLSLLVNKLGDPARKVASGAAHELRNTLNKHPAMQVVIAREVQQLAHRPQLSPRALYNCICFLNQLTLSVHNRELPVSLVRTYFGLFQVAIAQKKEKKDSIDKNNGSMKSRLLSALLQGVNRAHPYLPRGDQDLESHVDQLYRVVHQAPPSAATQALLLLFHVTVGMHMDAREDVASKDRASRFYRVLFQACGSSTLLTNGKHLTMMFNLLYKALKYDTDKGRVLALSKRLLLTTLHAGAPVIAAAIFLISEIGKVHRNVLEGMSSVLEGTDALRVLDPRVREPRGALVVAGDDKTAHDGVTKAPIWELSLLSHHYHPSVHKFSRGADDIKFSGDPLRDFGLSHFLDKFAYRNPKKSSEEKRHVGSVAASRRTHATMPMPMNDVSFLHKPTVDAPDQFFHIFFAEQARRDHVKGAVRRVDKQAEDADPFTRIKPIAGTIDFCELEEAWESDDEEEAFVDSLAEKIIEDSIDENGPADLDDEDPDMEGWDHISSDAGSDSDDEIAGYEQGENGDSVAGSTPDKRGVDDMDAFMDGSGDSSDDEVAPTIVKNSDGSGDDETVESLDDEDLDFLVDDDSEDDRHDTKSKKRRAVEVVFEDASKYEKIIESSWTEVVGQQMPQEQNSRSAKKPKTSRREKSSASK